MKIETTDKDVVKERFTIYLPEATVKQLRLLAVHQGKRYSKLVDDALLAYFLMNPTSETEAQGFNISRLKEILIPEISND